MTCKICGCEDDTVEETEFGELCDACFQIELAARLDLLGLL